MANYISIRGWLECDYEQVVKVREIIDSLNQDKEYKGTYDECWSFPSGGANWVAYIFFGCDVKLYRMDYFENILSHVCDSVNDIDGFFKIDGEEDDDHWAIKISSSNLEKLRP